MGKPSSTRVSAVSGTSESRSRSRTLVTRASTSRQTLECKGPPSQCPRIHDARWWPHESNRAAIENNVTEFHRPEDVWWSGMFVVNVVGDTGIANPLDPMRSKRTSCHHLLEQCLVPSHLVPMLRSHPKLNPIRRPAHATDSQNKEGHDC